MQETPISTPCCDVTRTRAHIDWAHHRVRRSLSIRIITARHEIHLLVTTAIFKANFTTNHKNPELQANRWNRLRIYYRITHSWNPQPYCNKFVIIWFCHCPCCTTVASLTNECATAYVHTLLQRIFAPILTLFWIHKQLIDDLVFVTLPSDSSFYSSWIELMLRCVA